MRRPTSTSARPTGLRSAISTSRCPTIRRHARSGCSRSSRSTTGRVAARRSPPRRPRPPGRSRRRRCRARRRRAGGVAAGGRGRRPVEAGRGRHAAGIQQQMAFPRSRVVRANRRGGLHRLVRRPCPEDPPGTAILLGRLGPRARRLAWHPRSAAWHGRRIAAVKVRAIGRPMPAPSRRVSSAPSTSTGFSKYTLTVRRAKSSADTTAARTFGSCVAT